MVFLLALSERHLFICELTYRTDDAKGPLRIWEPTQQMHINCCTPAPLLQHGAMTPSPTPVWAWKNRAAARRHLRKHEQSTSFDMDFVNLRGDLTHAFHIRKIATAETLLITFVERTQVSKTKLKKCFNAIGMCITTGCEEFQALRSNLRDDKTMRANLKDIKSYPLVRTLLVEM